MLTIAYLFVAGVVACRVAALFAWKMHELAQQDPYSLNHGKPQPAFDQWLGAFLMGLLAGCIWPITLVVILGRGFLLAPPKDVRLDQQMKRIEALERELNLR